MTEGARTRVIVSDAVGDRAWDAFVEAAPGGDHVQSSGWAKTKMSHGLGTARVVLEQDGHVVAGAQMLTRRIPMVGGIGYVPRGPVVPRGDQALAKRVVETLQEVAGARRIRHLVVQPPRGGDWIADCLSSWGYVPSALSVAPTATVLIDLSADLDEIFGRLSKTARKHVRRGARAGITIREGSQADLGTFHELLSATAARNEFTPYPSEYFSAMWHALHPQGHLRMFLAEYEGEAVSAHLVVPFGESLLSKVVAWSGKHADAYPNEALDWHVITWAKAHGFEYYDLEGIDRQAAERMVDDGSQTGGEDRTADTFKLKFGGEAVLLPKAFDYFPNRLLAHTYGRAYRKATAGGWPKASFSRLRTRRPGTKGGA